ncbi:MAG: 50S ribosomal protein L17 [Candidatus Yanofskybacteria bacterium GW2011_GWD2_39_48]|uniref:50S ribosomal protein L17 n=1 Tax=Candidatus Yanofskybacteria bacterium GW2011_GWD2_39_48 TaxID=1619031 RepID=A0A0G0SD00_9BACT|nr:MAG: 50S ribosomal protein L17 [Candidatus Yanofskybacteria bacterium GW2011_GWD2_39_48]
MKRGNIPKFGRTMDRRSAMHKALATALIEHGRIKTTEAKGKALVRFMSKLTRQAKKETISSKRELAKVLGSKAITQLTTIMPKLSLKGGCVRLIRLGQRKSDAASMVYVELIENSAK